MNAPFLAMLGWPEIMGIIVICLILFGAKKVPELMRGLGKGINEFKRATREVQDDLQRAIEEDPPSPRRKEPETHAVAQPTPTEEIKETEHSPADSHPAHPRD